MTVQLPNQRHLFDIPDDVAYLNTATMGPMPLSVAAAGHAGLDRKIHPWQLTSDQFFADTERIRPKLAALINADKNGIALTASASYGLATAAQNLPVKPGQTLLTLADQFPSNVYAWRALAARTGAHVETITATSPTDLSETLIGAIDAQTAIVACPHVRWTDGARIDLVAVGKACRNVGAALVVDLSQSCGAMAFDVEAVQPDFLVCVGYKWLFGPYGMGFMYAAPHRRNGRPLEENWIARAGSRDFTRLIDYRDEYDIGATRYDMGERSNFALLPAFEAAIDLILGWGIHRIEATLATRNRALCHALDEIGLTTLPETARGPHYLGVALPNGAPENLTARLAASQIYVSKRGQTLRITPHIYNTDTDMERLVGALRTLCPRPSIFPHFSAKGVGERST